MAVDPFCAVTLICTMACDLLDLRLYSVDWVFLLSLPTSINCNSSEADTTSFSVIPTTWIPYSVVSRSFKSALVGSSKSLIFSLYISRYDTFTAYFTAAAASVSSAALSFSTLRITSNISRTANGTTPSSPSTPIIECVFPDPVIP